MIPIFTIREFVLLPKMVAERAEILFRTLNEISVMQTITASELVFLDREIKIFSNLILVMLDYKIKIPNLEHYYVYDDHYEHHSIKIRTNFEIFNLLTGKNISQIYKDFK